jgi:predicted metal-binding protein
VGIVWENDVMDVKTMQDKLTEYDNRLHILPIKFDQIIFEERVKLKCFYCAKYNNNWKCPPNIPDIDYSNIIKEYDNLAIVYITININDDFDQVRYESTNKLHRGLLMLEKELWNDNNSLALSFIGGSCKLCKDGCAKDKCRQPQLARIPLEATGMNVVDSLKNIGIDVRFPIEDSLSRYGMILW